MHAGHRLNCNQLTYVIHKTCAYSFNKHLADTRPKPKRWNIARQTMAAESSDDDAQHGRWALKRTDLQPHPPHCSPPFCSSRT